MEELMPQLVWQCHYCGLETPEPDAHLMRAHGVRIEDVMRQREEWEARRQALERVLMMSQEMSESTRCVCCGSELSV